MRGDFEILLFAFSALHESSGDSSICRVTGIDAAPQRQNSASWSMRGTHLDVLSANPSRKNSRRLAKSSGFADKASCCEHGDFLMRLPRVVDWGSIRYNAAYGQTTDRQP